MYNKVKSIDIFCDIIDNYGDIGFVYRLAKEITKQDKSLFIRVFLNNLESFQVINSKINILKKIQVIDGIEYINMNHLSSEDYINIIPSEVAIEAFACELPEDYFINYENNLKLIINLEYFTLEEWTKDFHLHSSFVNLNGVKKYFYMPGLEKDRGGIIISSEKEEISKDYFIRLIEKNSDYKFEKNLEKEEFFATIFSYEFNFENFLISIEKYSKEINKKIYLLIFGEKTKEGFPKLYRNSNVELIFMNYVEQHIYDKFISYADFNLVRGEESFVRALVSGKAFLWHAYCQEDKIHLQKVEGYLKFIEKFFFKKKSFVKYSKIMYTYNSRCENNYNLVNLEFSDFLHETEDLNKVFSCIKNYTINNGNLINKLLDFINSQL